MVFYTHCLLADTEADRRQKAIDRRLDKTAQRQNRRTVTELSVTEYGFLDTPEFMPKFAGGDKTRSQQYKDGI